MSYITAYPSFCIAVVSLVCGFVFFAYREFRDCSIKEVLTGIASTVAVAPVFLLLCFLPDIQALYWTSI
jgi:hypothetical protein